jgi:HSF-type DNA-binding
MLTITTLHEVSTCSPNKNSRSHNFESPAFEANFHHLSPLPPTPRLSMYPSIISRPCSDQAGEQMGWPLEQRNHTANTVPGGVLTGPPSTVPIKQVRGRGSAQEVASSSTFPFRLHEMLNDAEEKKFDHVIAWQGPHGFIIHDRALLEKHVLPLYYLQTRYKSFTRQRKSFRMLVLITFDG